MATVIIGLDGADWQIVDSLLAEGQLPTLKKLIVDGCRGILKSTIPPHSPTAWASMVTGVNPGKHGIFDFTMVDGSYRKVPIEPMSKLGALPLWRILNGNGISTGIVNLPILYPPESVQGYLVCGMVTPWNAEVFTYPERLSHMIGNLRENWIIGEHLSQGGSLEEFLGEIKEKTKRQADLVLDLLDEFETSFLMVVFDGGDKVQHFFWKYWDIAHPRYELQASEKLKCAIPEYYRNLDLHLTRIIERLGESDIFVVSDHGFTALSQHLYIEKWLLDEGYLYFRSPIVTTSNRILGDVVRRIWKTTARLQPVKDAVKNNRVLSWLVERIRDTRDHKGRRPSDDVEWGKTRVFFAGLSSQTLRINLRGREKSGTVSEGEEYNELVHELRTRLLQISDPKRRCSVIRNVHHRDEVYYGPRVDDAPDLVIMAEEGYELQEGYPDHLLGPSLQYGRDKSGDHRDEGIFIASGPNVKKLERQIEVEMVDIMPTILYLNSLPIPRYVDGTVITSIVQKTFQDENPVEYTDAYGLLNLRSTDGFSVEERAMLEEHLRALGYC